MDNHSLVTADRTTHLKIAAIAVIATFVVVVVGFRAHLVGTGDSASGIFVNPRMESLLSPAQYARRLFFLNAGCAHDAPRNVDRAYVERMRNLIDGLKPGVKLLLFAFDRSFDERGGIEWERTGFYVPDAYVRYTARAHPEYFEWAASIHPYRLDCVAAL